MSQPATVQLRRSTQAAGESKLETSKRVRLSAAETRPLHPGVILSLRVYSRATK